MTINFFSRFKTYIKSDPSGRFDPDSDGDKEAFQSYNETGSTDYDNPADSSGEFSIADTASFEAIYGYLSDAIGVELDQKVEQEFRHEGSFFDPDPQSVSPQEPFDLPEDHVLDSEYYTRAGPGVLQVKEDAIYKISYSVSIRNDSSINAYTPDAQLQVNSGSGWNEVKGATSTAHIDSLTHQHFSGEASLSLSKTDNLRVILDYSVQEGDGPLIKEESTYSLLVTSIS